MSITRAIQQRLLLQIMYDGGHRIVEPHAFGHNAGKGHDLLRAYQVSGSSKTFEYVGWKLFRCDEMLSLQVLEQHFSGPRPGYKRGDKALDQIYSEL
jgi:hypothetical protein